MVLIDIVYTEQEIKDVLLIENEYNQWRLFCNYHR